MEERRSAGYLAVEYVRRGSGTLQYRDNWKWTTRHGLVATVSGSNPQLKIVWKSGTLLLHEVQLCSRDCLAPVG